MTRRAKILLGPSPSRRALSSGWWWRSEYRSFSAAATKPCTRPETGHAPRRSRATRFPARPRTRSAKYGEPSYKAATALTSGRERLTLVWRLRPDYPWPERHEPDALPRLG